MKKAESQRIDAFELWCWRRLLRVPWRLCKEIKLVNSSSAAAAKSLQSCPTLCDPIDGNPPGSAVPGILQARVLGWVAIALSGMLAGPIIRMPFYQ